MMSYYLDTNIFLNVIYKEPKFQEGSARLLEGIHEGRFQALTSAVTLLEIALDMAEEAHSDLADRALSAVEDIGNLEITPLTKTMAKLAANYVIADHLTVHDAYHLATAITQKAIAFITRDKDLARKILKYIKVNSPDEAFT